MIAYNRVRFECRTCSRRSTAGPLQQQPADDTRSRSRIRRDRARAKRAPAPQNVHCDPLGSDGDDVVYAAHRIATVLGKFVAACGKLAEKSDGLRRDTGIRSLELCLFRYRVTGCVAFSPTARHGLSGYVRRTPHVLSNTVANGRASLRDRLLSRDFGSWRARMFASSTARFISR